MSIFEEYGAFKVKVERDLRTDQCWHCMMQALVLISNASLIIAQDKRGIR